MQDTNNKIETIKDIRSLVAEDFLAVDQIISEQLTSKVPLIKTICEHIIYSGGKRLRPLLVLLVANALGYEGRDHVILSAIIEFIHTSTLLHDDVIDESELRRGKQTANTIWGNSASVLVGDFLYTRTFQLLTSLKETSVLTTLAGITKTIVEGEMLQLQNRNRIDVSENDYMSVIERKTAKLFEAGTKLAAQICDHQFEEQCGAYGLHLGMAFQLVDDVLDYSGTSEALGKNVGDDLAEGKATLPLIYALKNTENKDEKDMIESAILNGGIDNLDPILKTIHATNALEYSMDKAKEQSMLAINALQNVPDSEFKEALILLAKFAVNREY